MQQCSRGPIAGYCLPCVSADAKSNAALELPQCGLQHVPEVVYTFPLPHCAVPLSLAAEFDGRRLTGQILSGSVAEDTYEQALRPPDCCSHLRRWGPSAARVNKPA